MGIGVSRWTWPTVRLFRGGSRTTVGRRSSRFALGIYHYQYKVITRSWFEKEPEPALPLYNQDETKSDDRLQSADLERTPLRLLAAEENETVRKVKQEEYEKAVSEVRERNEQRAEQAKYTDLWYTFVDPYATDVDERGSDDAHKAVAILVIKNGFCPQTFTRANTLCCSL